MVFLSAGTAISISVCVLSVLFLIMYNCSICHCFHLITVDATNVIGLLHSFGYRASSQLLLLMEDRSSANHEKSWLPRNAECRSSKLLHSSDRDFSDCGVLGFNTMLP